MIKERRAKTPSERPKFPRNFYLLFTLFTPSSSGGIASRGFPRPEKAKNPHIISSSYSSHPPPQSSNSVTVITEQQYQQEHNKKPTGINNVTEFSGSGPEAAAAALFPALCFIISASANPISLLGQLGLKRNPNEGCRWRRVWNRSLCLIF